MKSLTHEKESIIPTKLISDMRNGNVIAWVGAGLSIGVGYPSWDKLINSIAEKIHDVSWSPSNLEQWVQENSYSNPEWVAEVLFSTNIREYYNVVKEIFGKEKMNESITHSLLVLLPFKGYITTNFDTLIESNIELFASYKPKVYNNTNASDFLTHTHNEKFVYKIHGDINSNIDDVVLTESDFYALQKNEIFNKNLSWVFSKHTIICFGYSLRDRDFRAILEERFQLFKGNCPPVYVFVSTNATCKEEIDCYRQKYNLFIVPISPDFNFEELSSTLLSLHCLCHRIESEHNSEDIVSMVKERRKKRHRRLGIIQNRKDLAEAHKLLCVLKDCFDKYELASILSENGIDTTTAHIELLCDYTNINELICDDEYDENEDRQIIAKHVKKILDVIPVDDNPRFLSVYYKNIIYKYSKTLIYLLGFESTWNILINNINDLKRIVEYFKQQGLWACWLEIANNAALFCIKNVKTELLRSIAWIQFWTRDYDSLQNLLKKNPEIENSSGVNNYKTKLLYMTEDGLNYIISKKETERSQDNLDYFDISLLGRSYARLSTIKKDKVLLDKAEVYVREALNLAIESKDLIEIAVQNWYLALILIDKPNLNEAKYHLAETKRLDENLMERIPGIAWLRVAEYRLALQNNSSQSSIQRSRNLAYACMDELGMKNIDQYLDNEYFF